MCVRSEATCRDGNIKWLLAPWSCRAWGCERTCHIEGGGALPERELEAIGADERRHGPGRDQAPQRVAIDADHVKVKFKFKFKCTNKIVKFKFKW